jgi:hypothetical protein
MKLMNRQSCMVINKALIYITHRCIVLRFKQRKASNGQVPLTRVHAFVGYEAHCRTVQFITIHIFYAVVCLCCGCARRVAMVKVTVKLEHVADIIRTRGHLGSRCC